MISRVTLFSLLLGLMLGLWNMDVDERAPGRLCAADRS